MRNLSSKLSVTLLGSLAATSILTGGMVIHNESRILSEQIKQDGNSLATTIAAMSVEDMVGIPDSTTIASHVELAAEANKRVRHIWVFDAEGRLLVEHPPGGELSKLSKRKGGLQVFRSPITYDAPGLPPETLGAVEVAFDNQWFSMLIRNSMARMVAGTTLTLALLASILLWSLRRNVLVPVALLDAQVSKIARGDLSQPIVLDRVDELGRFAKALETMRGSLNSSYARIEEQLSDLKKLDRMKDEFLANTSHELKTPLNGIVGIAESFVLGAYGQLDEEQQQAMKMISSCADRLCKMTDSILTFSRLQRLDPEDHSRPEVHCLAQHLEEALIDLYATAESLEIPLVLSVPPDLRVTYCRNELEQVVRILAANALKFTPEGVVEIVAKRWERGIHPGFQIAVRDTGPGIAPEMQEQVFEPFVQGFKHETRAYGGVGLGLAIAKKLVKRMGAEIVLESAVGKGSTFTVLVPESPSAVDLRSLAEPWPPFKPAHHEPKKQERVCLEESSSPLQVSSSKERGDSACHVLVVDDEAVNREVVWQLLRSRYKVTLAADGRSCLETLRANRVDLVLLDIMMPGMSGYDVLEAMRKEGMLEEVPVIVLSAKTSSEAVVKGLELGASDYLGKPFHRDELLCRLRNHLELKKSRDQLREEVAARTNALSLAEEASKVKSQFLANMSHELRTPLNGILGFTELSLESCRNCHPDHREHLNNIRDCAGSLLKTVNDILDISKIECREASVVRAPFRPRELLEKVCAAWHNEASRKKLSLELAGADGVEGEVWSDPPKLEQALNNVLGNAVKFTQQGGVRVAASLTAGNQESARWLEVKVSDTGIGIPPEKLAAVFLPFSQVDGSMTRKYGGTGLGLAVSRALARMLGGDITVASEPGVGSTFTVQVEVYQHAPECRSERQADNTASDARGLPAPVTFNKIKSDRAAADRVSQLVGLRETDL